MFDEMMGVERKVEEGLEEGEGFMEVLGLGDLWEFEKNDGVEREYMGFLLCPPSSLSLSASSTGSSRMLSFSAAPQKSNESFSLPNLSSSPSSITTSTTTSNSASKASKKAEATGGGRGRRISSCFTATVITSKKPKTEVSSSSGTIKVRKEKLGERITALQQLVSPFGKSDTASVLHEALGYIRFLHDQIQVLSSPYLQRLPHLHNGEVAARGGLRSRGLCLVPISCTEHVADSNGADLWSPSMGSSDNCSSSKH